MTTEPKSLYMVEKYIDFMDRLTEFSKRLEGKNLEKLIEKAKRESNELLLDQATASIALTISQIIISKPGKLEKLMKLIGS